MYFSQEDIDNAQINPVRKDLPGAGYYSPIVCEILEGAEWSNGDVVHRIGVERAVDDCIYWKRPTADEITGNLGLEEWISQTYPLWEIKEIGIVALTPNVNLSVTINDESSSHSVRPTSTTEPYRVRIFPKEDYCREISFKIGGWKGLGNIAIYAVVKAVGDTDTLCIPRDKNGEQYYWSYTDPSTQITKKQFITLRKTPEEKITYIAENTGNNWHYIIFDQLNDDYPCGEVTEIGVIPLVGGTGTFNCGIAEDKGSYEGLDIFKVTDNTVTLSTAEMVKFKFPVSRHRAIIYAARLRYQVHYNCLIYFKYIPHTLRFSFHVPAIRPAVLEPHLASGFRLDKMYFIACTNDGALGILNGITLDVTTLVNTDITSRNGIWTEIPFSVSTVTVLNTTYNQRLFISKKNNSDNMEIIMTYKKIF